MPAITVSPIINSLKNLGLTADDLVAIFDATEIARFAISASDAACKNAKFGVGVDTIDLFDDNGNIYGTLHHSGLLRIKSSFPRLGDLNIMLNNHDAVFTALLSWDDDDKEKLQFFLQQQLALSKGKETVK